MSPFSFGLLINPGAPHTECMNPRALRTTAWNPFVCSLCYVLTNVSWIVHPHLDCKQMYEQRTNCEYKLRQHTFSFSLYSFFFPLSPPIVGVNAMSKEVTASNALSKRSLMPDRQVDSPPKRPKSNEAKISVSEQVRVTSWLSTCLT